MQQTSLSASAGAQLVNGPTGPKATHIAYMSKVDGEADIYGMTTEDFAVTNLTHDKTVGLRADSEPAWSPDGQWVAFQRTAVKAPGVRLFVVRSDDRICTRSRHRAISRRPTCIRTWSPDGQTIVFSSDRTGHFELYMANVKGGIATRLTFTMWSVDNLEPAWSPDGTMIVFVRHEWNMFPEIPSYPTDSIYTLKLTSSLTHPTYRITYPDFGKSDCQPAWSGDSAQIAFESNRDLHAHGAGSRVDALPAMTQLTFDKAPKGAPGHGAHDVHGPNQLTTSATTTKRARPRGPLLVRSNHP